MPVVQTAINQYFIYCHNQPLSLFDEQRFRQRWEHGLIPQYLLLVIIASALRFSDDSFPQDKHHELIRSYSRHSWTQMVNRWTNQDVEENPNVVQAVLLHCLIDIGDGQNYRASVKLALAVRISQELRLMLEPDSRLDLDEQEERRRIFWSAYVLDKFITCKRTRPSAILDDDCKVRLPMDGYDLLHGDLLEKEYALDQLKLISTPQASHLSPFAVLVLIASTLGQCSKYSLHEYSCGSNLPPWDSSSAFSAISSSLMVFEAVFGLDESFAAMSLRYSNVDGMVDPRMAGQLILSRAIFHLCNILLCHPLLLLRRAHSLKERVPESFLRRTNQTSRDHAVALTVFLRDSFHAGYRGSNVMIAYCTFVAGVTHCLHLACGLSDVVDDYSELAEFSMTSLNELASKWPIAGSMLQRLRALHNDSLHHNETASSSVDFRDLDKRFADGHLRLMDQGLVVEPSAKDLPSHSILKRYEDAHSACLDEYSPEFMLPLENATLPALGSDMDGLPTSGVTEQYRSELVCFDPSPLASFLMAQGMESVGDHGELPSLSS
ncbi:hypothetical protein AYL99_00180 [Fonsecaea erecta]|uniref:Xylanolytic transcriptional activator regulatory domain-containing protein n=1 Tax=Fonsecaea erecta TaxID=1367422 RepID=A0A178ZWJ5_9EURO|nr:hypothetical protein AYL99_00180 [Fonsecaea erecta]OAP64208.1 hypothetical protein AYL99_00180 [Fonsecaea erecta]